MLSGIIVVSCDYFYTPGIYAEGYIAFALTFVRSSVRMFVRVFVRSLLSVTFLEGLGSIRAVFGLIFKITLIMSNDSKELVSLKNENIF